MKISYKTENSQFFVDTFLYTGFPLHQLPQQAVAE